MREKNDKRRKAVRTRAQKQRSGGKYDKPNEAVLRKAIFMRTEQQFSISQIAKNCKLKRSPVGDLVKRFHESRMSVDEFFNNKKSNYILLDNQERAVEDYCLWQCDRGMPLNNYQIKAIIGFYDAP